SSAYDVAQLVLEHLRDVDGVPADAVGPWPVGVARRRDALPRGAVALEAGAEPDHPHAVAGAHAALGLDVGQLVPHRAARRVAEPVQRHPRRLHVLVGEPQAALQLVDHRAAAGVDAEVLERHAEVREVRLHPPVQHPPRDEGQREQELLRRRQDEGPDGGDVRLERVAGDGHEVLGEVDAPVSLAVLLLEHAPVRAVLGAGQRPHDAGEAEPCLGARRGQQHGGAAHPEEAVGQEHRALLADVVVWRDGLRRHDQRVRAVRRHLQEVAGEADGDEARAAAHPGEVHVADVAAHLVVVDDHVGEGGDGREEAAVDDEDVDRGGADARLGEQVVDGVEDDDLHFGARRLQVPVRRDEVVRRRQARLLPEPRPLEQPRHEPHAALVDGRALHVRHQLGVLEERGERDAAVGLGAEARVVDEVHGARPQHEVQRRGRRRHERCQEDVHRPQRAHHPE
ncbi:Os06g0260250, partial [Oryza sativa Japonica Group]